MLSGRQYKIKIGTRLLLAVSMIVLGLAPSVHAGSQPEKSWRAVVKRVACVEGPSVLLGEIAYPVHGVDDRLWQSVATAELWKASEKKGRPLTVPRQKLKKILKYYLGDMVDQLVLPAQLTVQRGGRVLSEQQLQHSVVNFMTVRAADLGGEIELKDIALPQYFFFENKDDKLDISLGSTVHPGRNLIRLKAVSSTGKELYSKAGTVFLNVWKTVPVAAKPLNRKERVTQEKVNFMRVNLAYRSELWDGTGGPWRMKRTLGRGQPFTLSHIELVPTIEKGQRVILLYRKKRVQLSIKAEALGEAGIGEQVLVRNLQSHKKVLATVVAENTVIIR